MADRGQSSAFGIGVEWREAAGGCRHKLRLSLRSLSPSVRSAWDMPDTAERMSREPAFAPGPSPRRQSQVKSSQVKSKRKTRQSPPLSRRAPRCTPPIMTIKAAATEPTIPTCSQAKLSGTGSESIGIAGPTSRRLGKDPCANASVPYRPQGLVGRFQSPLRRRRRLTPYPDTATEPKTLLYGRFQSPVSLSRRLRRRGG
jgi:hypothetical protein